MLSFVSMLNWHKDSIFRCDGEETGWKNSKMYASCPVFLLSERIQQTVGRFSCIAFFFFQKCDELASDDTSCGV